LFIQTLQECPTLASYLASIIGGLAAIAIIVVIAVCCYRNARSAQTSPRPVASEISLAWPQANDETAMFGHPADLTARPSSSDGPVPYQGAFPAPTHSKRKTPPRPLASAASDGKEMDPGLGKDGFPVQDEPERNTNK
jgi:hypothetical protein